MKSTCLEKFAYRKTIHFSNKQKMNEIEICLLTKIHESWDGKTSQPYVIYVHTSFMFVVFRFSKIWKRFEFSHLGLGNLDHDRGVETQTSSI